MRFIFQPLKKQQALMILNWQYPYPYDCYNFNADTVREDLHYFLDEKNAFFAVLNLQGKLEGYCSFGSDGQVSGGNYNIEALDIGMGIRPDLVGQGRGKQYAQAVAMYGTNRYTAKHLRVTIRDFNKRAQKTWQHLGFEQIEKFIKIGTKEKFVIMICTVSSLPKTSVKLRRL